MFTPVNHNQAFAAPPSIDGLIDFRKQRFHPRPDSSLYLSNEEPILGYLKFSAKGTKSKVFGMPIPDSLITAEIQQATYYQEYLEKPAPTSAPAKSQENKRKQATETTDKRAKAKRIKRSISRKTRQPISSPKSVGVSEAEEVPTEEPQVADEDADYQKAMKESMKDSYALPKRKGKAKVTEEQVSHDLPSLQKHKKTSLADQYIFQRRVFKPTGSSRHDESPYALLGQSDNEEESEKVVLGADEGGQDKDQAGPNPDAQAKDQTGSDAGAQADGQAGSNPDETFEGQAGPDSGGTEAKVQSISSPVVHAGSDREHMDLDIANVSP
nr:E-beta-farnesene synthase [Tanacetum cinerariifolium]